MRTRHPSALKTRWKRSKERCSCPTTRIEAILTISGMKFQQPFLAPRIAPVNRVRIERRLIFERFNLAALFPTRSSVPPPPLPSCLPLGRDAPPSLSPYGRGVQV